MQLPVSAESPHDPLLLSHAAHGQTCGEAVGCPELARTPTHRGLRTCSSYGSRAVDRPGVSDGAAWLSREIAAKLYAEDVEQHWQGMQDYATPELNGEEWTPTDLPSEDDKKGKVA